MKDPKISELVSALLFAVAILVVFAATGHCQQFSDAPSPKFLDRETVLELSLSGGAFAADAYSTVHNAAFPESNPILGSYPSTGKDVAYFSSAFAGELGAMYVFRRHKWIKRLIPIAVTAVEFSFAARNLHSPGYSHQCFAESMGVFTPSPCGPGTVFRK